MSKADESRHLLHNNVQQGESEATLSGEHAEVLPKARLEAFSDGVFSVIVTIMVIDLKTPPGSNWSDLGDQMKLIGLYLLSFVYVSIYWTNHHVLLEASAGVDGTALWANLSLLFSLSLLPFTTRWMGDDFESVPVCAYGIVLLMSAISFAFTSHSLASVTCRVTGSVPNMLKIDAKIFVSTALYAIGAGVSNWSPYAGIALYMLVALFWFVRIMFSRCIHDAIRRRRR
jgi:uncharacterized membrane protein